MNHILRDYFMSHIEYNYVYDEIEKIGHEWKFWREELKMCIRDRYEIPHRHAP